MSKLREQLKLTPLFVRLEDPELDVLLKVARKESYRSGEVIVSEGEPGDSLFLILDGVVEIYKKGNTRNIKLITLQKDESFGELFLVDIFPRSATAIALEKSRLLRFDSEDIALACRDYSKILPIMVTNIARILSRRLRAVNDRVVDILDKNGE